MKKEMKLERVVQEIVYKKHIITKMIDDFSQESVIIDNNFDKKLVSIADAKRVIRGLKPKYEFI